MRSSLRRRWLAGPRWTSRHKRIEVSSSIFAVPHAERVHYNWRGLANDEARVSGSGGVGHFVSWDGGCLLIGRAIGVTPMHAHYAIQIAFGSEPGIRFRPTQHDEWTDYPGVVIASFSAFGHLGGVMEVVSKAPLSDEAMRVFEAKLNICTLPNLD